jgi:hypothetical protein
MKTLSHLATPLAILGAFLPSVLEASVNMAVIERQARYNQTDASTVISDTITFKPFVFSCFIGEGNDATVLSAVTLTGPTSLDEITYDSGDGWSLKRVYTSQAFMLSAYPAGNYSLALTKTSDGQTYTTNFTLTNDMVTLPDTIPQVSNFDALQSADPSGAITISWNAWVGGTSEDAVTVYVETQNGDEVYSTPDPDKADHLPGTATSTVIPAETLLAGTSYRVSVSFYKLFIDDSEGALTGFPGAMKGVACSNETILPLKTSGQAPLSALLSFQLWNHMSWEITALDGVVTAEDRVPGTAAESVSIQSPSAAYLATTAVTLTGPAGSGLSTTQAAGVFYNNGIFTYSWNATPYLADGAYSVNFDGSIHSDSAISYAPQAADNYLLVPSLTLRDGVIQSLSWTARLRSAPHTVVSLTESSKRFSLELRRTDYSGNLYSDYDIPASTTSIDLASQAIAIRDVGQIFLVCTGEANAAGSYNQIFSDYALSMHENIFAGLTHYGAWIPPADPVNASFGWVSDLFYPWVYSVSLDEMANGTYLGDGKGWIYLMAGASLENGFYFFRWSTGTWCYSNYNWGGWFYDFGGNGHETGWFDMTLAP